MRTGGPHNVDRHREALEAFGRHDIDGMLACYDEDLRVVDHAQHLTITSHEGLRAWGQEWVRAFPDSKVADIEIIDGGEWTVARFVGRGTNDGPMGPFEPTGMPMESALCDVARWQDGRIVEEHIYYDLYGVLAQLGHVPSMDPGA